MKRSSKPRAHRHGRVARDNACLSPSDWSADGRFVLYTFTGSFPATSDIWALPLFGDRKPFPVVQTQFSESLGTFSPDGRWIAYTTNETGEPNVYVAAISSCWREVSDLAERRTQSAVERQWQGVVLSRCERGDDGRADRRDRYFHCRVAKDTLSGWSDQRQPDVRGDQGWTAVPRQRQTAECCRRTPLTVIVNWTSTLLQ